MKIVEYNLSTKVGYEQQFLDLPAGARFLFVYASRGFPSNIIHTYWEVLTHNPIVSRKFRVYQTGEVVRYLNIGYLGTAICDGQEFHIYEENRPI